MNNKGQLSLINIVFWVIIVGVGAVVTPILAEFANEAVLATNSTTAQIVAGAIVPMFWLGVIITFFIFVVPQGIRQQ